MLLVLFKPVIMFMQLFLNFASANNSGVQLLFGQLTVSFNLLFLLFELHNFKLAIGDEFCQHSYLFVFSFLSDLESFFEFRPVFCFTFCTNCLGQLAVLLPVQMVIFDSILKLQNPFNIRLLLALQLCVQFDPLLRHD